MTEEDIDIGDDEDVVETNYMYEDMKASVDFKIKVLSIEAFPSIECQWKADIYFKIEGYDLDGSSIHQMEMSITPQGSFEGIKEMICRNIEKKIHSSLVKLTAPKWSAV